MRTGFLAETSASTLWKRSPSLAPSMYAAMISVSESWPKYSRSSVSLMSTALPYDTALLKRTPRWLEARSRYDVLPPLCPMRATLPTRRGKSEANVSPVLGEYTPKQLGPTMRILAALARRTISFSSCRPSSVPTSEKPEVYMDIVLTPLVAQSLISCGTNGAGMQQITKSTGPGMSLMLL